MNGGKDYADALAALQGSLFSDSFAKSLGLDTLEDKDNDLQADSKDDEEVAVPVTTPQWKPLRSTKNICGNIQLLISTKNHRNKWETKQMTSNNNSIRLGLA